MKKVVIVITGVILVVVLLQCLPSARVEGSITALLSNYEIELDGLRCTGGSASRVGHCEFTLSAEKIDVLKVKLAQDYSAKKPAYQTPMPSIGDGACPSQNQQIEILSPNTQLGGGKESLPYLGSFLVNRANGTGCFYFQYSYG